MPLCHPLIRLLRLDAPVGIWLVLFPALWGLLLSQPSLAAPWLFAAMLAGAVLMRSAGCIVNDLTDRNLDGAVSRTRDRPLASGALYPMQAYAALVLLLVLALVLAMALPPAVLWLGLLALPLIAAYPWMKRLTWWPQLFLGVTFNFSALIGWAATGAPLSMAAIALYLACVCWTLGYDTAYAMQDATDDAVIGIRSTARRFASRIPAFVTACYGLMVSLLLLSFMLVGAGNFALIGVLGVAAHSLWQVWQLQRTDATARAARVFRSNQWLGVWLFFFLLLDRASFQHSFPGIDLP